MAMPLPDREVAHAKASDILARRMAVLHEYQAQWDRFLARGEMPRAEAVDAGGGNSMDMQYGSVERRQANRECRGI